MRELSLFSGAGGGLLGTYLLGWKHIGYVEFNDYCQRVIRQRILDGILPNAPIFGDIQTFISDGYAASYQGMVDVITGGFPCQPFSNAGKRLGADDPRNMWPATIECLRIIRPRYALLENVPGLLTSGYFGTVLGDLAESGFDCRWRILSAAEMGAPHRRERLWIVANAHGYEHRRTKPRSDGTATGVQSQYRATDDSAGQPSGTSEVRRASHNDATHTDAASARRPSAGMADAREAQRGRSSTRLAGCGWWAIEPDLGRVANGVPARLDRLKALGNGQVPAVVRAAWDLLSSDFVE
jgi:DNA (cytosine-5)-methyltransferase 1